MIEIRSAQDPNHKYRGLLLLDGVVIENAHVSINSDQAYSVTALDGETSKALAAHGFSDFPPTPDYLELRFYPDHIEHLDGREGLHILKGFYHDGLTISFPFGGDSLTEWKAPYTFADYGAELYSVLDAREDVVSTQLVDKDNESVNYRIDHSVEPMIKDGIRVPSRVKIDFDEVDKNQIHGISATFAYSPDEIIADAVDRFSSVINEVHTQVLKRLGVRLNDRAVVASFKDFPKEVRTYCEQYLMYFIQFLLDLGVDATSELRHEAGRVLFTVTPSNEHEALDKIRAALDIYLHLPTSPIGSSPGSEIAVNRLEAAVLRLQSDLRLAAAELQAKNATVEAQQITIDVQRGLLSGEISIGQMKDVTPKEDREEFLDGAFALTVLRKEGFEFNLAKIFRMLKEKFVEKD
jgi:hypothetical protein